MNHARTARLRALLPILVLAVAGCGTPATPTQAPATAATAGATPSGSAGPYDSWKPDKMTDEQAATVVKLSIDAVNTLGIAAGYENGAIVTMAGTVASLDNLALALLAAPESDWPSLIEDHFRQAFKVASASGAPVPSTWQEARLFLRVAVRADTYFNAEAVTRQAATGLVAGLVYDQASAFVVVPRAIFAQWGVSEDQAFETGLENTLAEPAMSVDRDESDAVVYAVGSSYASTYALAVDKLFASASPNGAIVGVPTRAKVVVVPLRNRNAVDAMRQYPSVIVGDYKAGPYPVSPFLYWWYGGRLTPITDATGKLTVPAQLQKILDALPQ